jgi:hypothetical protein
VTYGWQVVVFCGSLMLFVIRVVVVEDLQSASEGVTNQDTDVEGFSTGSNGIGNKLQSAGTGMASTGRKRRLSGNDSIDMSLLRWLVFVP